MQNFIEFEIIITELRSVIYSINILRKALIIHEQNTKKIIAVKEFLYAIKHVDFHKTFASIFSAYTTSILKILS